MQTRLHAHDGVVGEGVKFFIYPLICDLYYG